MHYEWTYVYVRTPSTVGAQTSIKTKRTSKRSSRFSGSLFLGLIVGCQNRGERLRLLPTIDSDINRCSQGRALRNQEGGGCKSLPDYAWGRRRWLLATWCWVMNQSGVQMYSPDGWCWIRQIIAWLNQVVHRCNHQRDGVELLKPERYIDVFTRWLIC